jgi:PD-(D/E)XK nuclease superfamily
MNWKPPAENTWTPKAPVPESETPVAEAKPWENKQVWVPGQPAPAPAEPEPVDPQGGAVRAWSASQLDNFERCPHAVFLAKVKKIPQESGAAAERGTMIHDLAEHYVDGTISEMPEELKQYERDFDRLREGYANATVTVEEDWGFNLNWDITGWMAQDVWARMKLDACEREDETSAKVIDYKTGRKWGNEIKHNRQAMIYGVGAFMRYPDVEFITTEFWYLDQKDGPLINHYARNRLPIILPGIEKRAIKLTSCTDFKPKPSRDACKWCSYAKDGSCEWSYQG